MIQRIQTVYLLLAAVASFLLFVLPIASTDAVIAGSDLFADAKYTIQDNIVLTILFVLTGIAALAAIFLFKNRPLQRNLGRVALALTIIGVIFAIVFFMQDGIVNTSEAISPADGIGAFLPVLSIIFIVLAIRGINKDEKTVRSMDRLRD